MRGRREPLVSDLQISSLMDKRVCGCEHMKMVRGGADRHISRRIDLKHSF